MQFIMTSSQLGRGDDWRCRDSLSGRLKELGLYQVMDKLSLGVARKPEWDTQQALHTREMTQERSGLSGHFHGQC